MKTQYSTVRQTHSDGAGTRAILFFTPLLACVGLGLAALSARAGVLAKSQEVHVYAGGFFGDNLIDGAIAGRTLKLKDSFTFGARYGYNVTPQWGAELSLGHSLSKVKGTPAGDLDFNVTTLELAAVRHFAIPSAPRYIPYLTFGGGYAFANLDRPIVGTRNGQGVSIGDRNSFTAVAGSGVKYMVTERTMLRFDTRYRYIDKLANSFGSRLNTFEATAGIGWRF
ncbi:MAG: outer rane beta-barrel protein [Verrucomicrobia bacterium]|nr:outer rane beta-barrel protein [Verrucomicrobiota bacterium]